VCNQVLITPIIRIITRRISGVYHANCGILYYDIFREESKIAMHIYAIVYISTVLIMNQSLFLNKPHALNLLRIIFSVIPWLYKLLSLHNM
jgi:hypothetical protein